MMDVTSLVAVSVGVALGSAVLSSWLFVHILKARPADVGLVADGPPMLVEEDGSDDDP